MSRVKSGLGPDRTDVLTLLVVLGLLPTTRVHQSVHQIFSPFLDLPVLSAPELFVLVVLELELEAEEGPERRTGVTLVPALLHELLPDLDRCCPV